MSEPRRRRLRAIRVANPNRKESLACKETQDDCRPNEFRGGSLSPEFNPIQCQRLVSSRMRRSFHGSRTRCGQRPFVTARHTGGEAERKKRPAGCPQVSTSTSHGEPGSGASAALPGFDALGALPGAAGCPVFKPSVGRGTTFVGNCASLLFEHADNARQPARESKTVQRHRKRMIHTSEENRS